MGHKIAKCTKCGSPNIVHVNMFEVVDTGNKYPIFTCVTCGKNSQLGKIEEKK